MTGLPLAGRGPSVCPKSERQGHTYLSFFSSEIDCKGDVENSKLILLPSPFPVFNFLTIFSLVSLLNFIRHLFFNIANRGSV